MKSLKFNLLLLCSMFAALVLPTDLHAKECESNLTGAVEKLPKDIAETLKVSAAAFCGIQQARKSPVHPVRITGTTRSISDQARYIYQCMQRNGCAIYENQEAVSEYNAIKNLTPLKLERQIKDQLKRNCFISKHLSNRAVDIGTRNMPKQLVSQLAHLISNTEYYVDGKKYKPQVINRNHGTGPHLHINFKPYYFDPSKCPKEYRFETKKG